jgi:RNA recognition motif-containing protein
MRRVAVENLTLNVDSEHLQEVFSSFGTVLRTAVILEENSGLSKGYGFVEFQDSADAATSIVFMNGGILDGNTLRVSFVSETENLVGR